MTNKELIRKRIQTRKNKNKSESAKRKQRKAEKFIRVIVSM